MKYRMKRHAVTQPLDQSYRLIPLTQRQNAIVDTCDFEWLRRWNWYAMWNPHTQSFYAVTKFRISGVYSNVFMARLILGCNPTEEGDHIDGDTLNNRRDNLRKCIPLQNSKNRSKNRNNTSGFKGVSWREKEKRWRAAINVDGKKLWLGYFNSKEAAANAYDEAAKIHHGQFAHPNFI